MPVAYCAQQKAGIFFTQYATGIGILDKETDNSIDENGAN